MVCPPSKRPLPEPPPTRSVRPRTELLPEDIGSDALDGKLSVAPPVPQRSSLRGLTRGVVKVKNSASVGEQSECWLCIDGPHLDVLLAALSHPRLHVTRVFCRGPVPLLMSRLHEQGSIHVFPWPSSPQGTDPALGVGVLVISNVRLRGPLFQFLLHHQVWRILGANGSRAAPPPWLTHGFRVIHSAVGGVTTTSSRFTLLSLEQDLQLAPVPSRARPRDLSTVLAYADAGMFGPRPDPSTVRPLRVVLVGSDHHGGGLMSPQPSLTTTVITPSKGANKSFRWGRRPLLPKELLQILDVPQFFLPALMDVFPDVTRFTPRLSLEAAIAVALDSTGGGFFFRQTPCRSPSGSCTNQVQSQNNGGDS